MTWPWVVAFIVLWATVVALTILVIGLLRRISPALEQAEQTLRASNVLESGLAPGSPAGAFTVWDAEGRAFTDADLRGEPSIVVFVERGCDPCDDVASELSGLAEPATAARVFVVTDASATESAMSLGPHVTVLHDADKSAARAFNNTVFPYGFALDATGILVARGIATSVDAIHRLGEAVVTDGRPLVLPVYVSAVDLDDHAPERHERR